MYLGESLRNSLIQITNAMGISSPSVVGCSEELLDNSMIIIISGSNEEVED